MELTPATQKWKLRAAEQQQTFYTLFGDREWDKLNKAHFEFRDNLQLKISYALYARSYTNCTSDQKARIDSVMEKIQELPGTSESLLIGYTFVSTWDQIDDGIVPLLRVKGDNDETFIVTEHADVYDSWNEYLEKNRLVNVDICYPRNGVYKRRAEGRVLVEYGKSSALREFPVHSDTPTETPLEASVFFPFCESSSSDTKFSVQWSMTYVTIKKLKNVRKPCTEADALAIWFKLITPTFGTVMKNESNLTSIALDAKQTLSAIDFFKSFYETPYSINGHFAVVRLMKIIAIRSVEKLNRQLLNEFASLLKFVVNVSIAQIRRVEEILKILCDDDSRLHSIFNVVVNTSYQSIKEMKFIQGNDSITYVLDLITKCVLDDSVLYSLTKEMIVALTNIAVKMKKTSCKEFGALASNVIGSFKALLHEAYIQEIELLRDELFNILKGMTGTDESIRAIRLLPRETLKVISNCVNKVSTTLTPTEISELCKKQFLKFAFDFILVDTIKGPIDVSDLFLFQTGKFVTKCRAFFIEYESRSSISNGVDAEGLFHSFLVSLKKPDVLKELGKDYTEVCNLSEKKRVGAPIINYKGMCVRGQIMQDDWLRLPLGFGIFCNDTMREYLGVGELPATDIYNDPQVVMFKKDSKYVLNIILHPPSILSFFRGMGLGARAGEIPDVNIAININYTLPSN